MSAAVEDKDLSERIALKQELPIGKCTRCKEPTGKIAPYYARLELPDRGITIRLPFCEACIILYLVMVYEERPGKKMRKTAP
jgi:hypothetical protein